MNNFCVVTTVNLPTPAIEKLHNLFGGNLIVVGDMKTPAEWAHQNTRFLSWSFGHYQYAPFNHYARKNLGYLAAIKSGAELIYDTDDDNIPNDVWRVRNEGVRVFESKGAGWFNPYYFFSDDIIWPRGFSLRHINKEPLFRSRANQLSSIQQGLADGEPDVDAIWRLTIGCKHKFQAGGSFYLNRDTWCPFNSQSTWFFPKAFPLMYLPVHASFRMTDIWRSFVAQKCLWEIGEGVTFHSPSEVYQDRNEHDLLKDFEDEIPGYLKNDLIVETLSALKLKPGEENMCSNMLTCYQAIVDKGVLPEAEIHSLKAWIRDYKEATYGK